MALIHWEPFREIEIIGRQMDQFLSEMTTLDRRNSDIFRSSKTGWVPAVELHDQGSELVLKVEIPGVKSEDLDIEVTQDTVSLAGEHHNKQSMESNGNIRSEFHYGKFKRIVTLPSKVQHQQVKADLKDGILTLSLPKLQPENNVFKVNLGNSQS